MHDMVDLDLHRLRMLRELQVRGTLAAVAAALGYSPSAVSQQLATLERETGAALLEKAGRGVQLTEAGRVLAEHAGRLLAAAEAARADLARLTGDIRGTVRVGGLQSATRRVLIPALARLAVEHADVRVEITEMELEQALPDLRLGTLDLVASDEYDGHPRPRPAGVRFETLHREPLRLVLPAGHRLARGRGPVSITRLRDETWVASAAGTGHHTAVIDTCRSLGGFDPAVRHRSNDAEVQLDFVRLGIAVALMAPLAMPDDDPALAVREVAERAIGRRLLLAVRDTPTAPALDAYLDAVRAQARGLPSYR